MGLINDKDQYERLDMLIRLRATGPPDDLAKTFNTSKSTISRMIKEMQSIGCPIYFCRYCNSYRYEHKGKLIIGFIATCNDEERFENKNR